MKDDPVPGHEPCPPPACTVLAPAATLNEQLRSIAISSVPIFEVNQPWPKRAKAK
jgi:hypothetical protein